MLCLHKNSSALIKKDFLFWNGAAAENKNVARPFAICADDKLVGFTMFAFDVDFDNPNDRYWLWRFMIDRELQGKGYGSAALEMIM